MREIKFRAWSRRHKRYMDSNHLFVDASGAIFYEKVSANGRSFELRNWILEQYTGLHGKNGKKIFEGDILQNKKYMSVVEFSGCAFLAKVYFGGKPTKQYFNLRGEIIASEVVGNIHQSAGLLEVEKNG